MHHLWSRGPVRRAAFSRPVSGESFIDERRASYSLVGLEAEGSAANHLRDLFEWISARQPLGHNRAHVARPLAERVRQQPERLLEPEYDSLVIGRKDGLDTL